MRAGCDSKAEGGPGLLGFLFPGLWTTQRSSGPRVSRLSRGLWHCPFAALCSGDPMAKPVGRAADHKSMYLCDISSPLASSCTGASPVLPGHLLRGSTTTPVRLRSPLPTLTCPCGGDDLGLAAGTISLGCVGSDCDGVGGFRQQASNDRLLGAHPRGREEANEKSKQPLPQ